MVGLKLCGLLQAFLAARWLRWVGLSSTLPVLAMVPSVFAANPSIPASALSSVAAPGPRLQPIRLQDRSDGDRDDPLARVQRVDEEIKAAARRSFPDWSPEATARQMRIDRLLMSFLDYDDIAQRALDPTWATLSEADRRKFLAIFAQLTGRTFLSAMTHQRTQITFENEIIAGARASVVGTACDPRSGCRSTDRIEYLLALKQGHWLVIDVIVGDVSMVEGYRQQFRQLVKKEGFEGLLSRMKKKLAAEP